MERVTIDQIRQSARQLNLDRESSYIVSYPEFIRYFASLKEITTHELVIAAHFTYGWMPTILDLKGKGEGYNNATRILNTIKCGGAIDHKQIVALQQVINNSIVGVSKLLHFVQPESYPIWDSKVYRYINGKKPTHYSMAKADNYLLYIDNCQKIVEDKSFQEIHIVVNNKLQYRVSRYRAVELVMYLSTS